MIGTATLKKAQKKLQGITDKLNFPADENGYPWRTGICIGANCLYLYVREKTDEIVNAIPKTVDVEDLPVPVVIVETGVIKPA